MIEASGLSLSLDAGLEFMDEASKGLMSDAQLTRSKTVSEVAHELGISAAEFNSIRLIKRSVDARKKSNVHFTVTLELDLSNASETRLLKNPPRGISIKQPKPYIPLEIPTCTAPAVAPVVVGAGPAGLFAALCLARAGLRPILIERGAPVEQRQKDVDSFMKTGRLNPESNIQFGEGGAGTFSDGKLTTNTKNPLTAHVLHWFVEAGAPRDILWLAHPHLGSDKLPDIVATMRNEIIARGGSVLFHTRLVDMNFENNALAEIVIETSEAEEIAARAFNASINSMGEKTSRIGELASGCLAQEDSDLVQSVPNKDMWASSGKTRNVTRTLPAHKLVLACGHSARDVFELCHSKKFAMEQKPFSVGVRIEHPQSMINESQWGKAAQHKALGSAEYKMAVHLPSGRSVYTFCMCPGGEVVAAASEEGGIVTNGMSNYARNGKNANAAVLVSVEPRDFPSSDVLSGIEFQKAIERAAFECSAQAGGMPYQAPCQSVGEFLESMQSAYLVKKDKGVLRGKRKNWCEPTYGRGVVSVPIKNCLPSFVSESLAEALPLFACKLKGFDNPSARLTAPETRSSSPVRICRSKSFEAYFVQQDTVQAGEIPRSTGVFPCGEGPGFAGGIMSAAVDGLRVAQEVIRQYAE